MERRYDSEHRSFSEVATAHSHSAEAAIPLRCFEKFMNTLNDKFSEMIELHSEMIRNVVHRKEARDRAVRDIVEDSLLYSRANSQLQYENSELERLRSSTYRG